MPRDGAIIFGNLIGKLAVLRIECATSGDPASTGSGRLTARYGPNAKVLT